MNKAAPGRGIGPRFTDSKAVVLPLDDPGMTNCVDEKTRTSAQIRMKDRSRLGTSTCL